MQASSRLIARTSTLSSRVRPTSTPPPPPLTTSLASSPWTTTTTGGGGRRTYPLSNVRTISYSPSSWAREAGSNNPFEDGPSQFQEHAPLFERIMQHPEVMQSIENMALLTQRKTGVNLQAGDKPSLSMMYQLARDPELRQAAERLMKALKDAGIEVDPNEAFKALRMMGDGSLADLKGDLQQGINQFNHNNNDNKKNKKGGDDESGNDQGSR